jgi:hypothetical protein
VLGSCPYTRARVAVLKFAWPRNRYAQGKKAKNHVCE